MHSPRCDERLQWRQDSWRKYAIRHRERPPFRYWLHVLFWGAVFLAAIWMWIAITDLVR